MKYFYLNTSKELLDFARFNWVGIYGNLGKCRGVVQHNAANGMSATAYSTAQYTVGSMDSANYHNAIDDNGNCYAIVSQEVGAYHTGTQEGNEYYIGVEITPSLTGGSFANQTQKDDFYKAWIEGCKLTADYLVFFGLTKNDVVFHQDFKATACPYTTIKFFGSYDKALSETRKKVGEFMEQIKNEKAVHYYMKVKLDTENFRYFDPKGQRYIMEGYSGGNMFFKPGNFLDDNNLASDKPLAKGQLIQTNFKETKIVGNRKYWIHEGTSQYVDGEKLAFETAYKYEEIE